MCADPGARTPIGVSRNYVTCKLIPVFNFFICQHKQIKAKKISALFYSNEPDLQHGFNALIGRLIQVRGAEISSEKCHILTVWFGKAISHTSWRIAS